MKDKITPGPWVIVEGCNIWREDSLEKICEVYPFKANAKAISAVPEMIEALKVIYYNQHMMVGPPKHFRKVQEALKKAGQL